jgi:hypothetical protein
MSSAEWWVIAVLRGVLFVGGVLFSLWLSIGLAWSGSVPAVVVYGVLAMAPAALVCWVLTATRAGDRWTFAYVSVWAAGILVATVRHLVVTAL